jgi:hypothetical protein
MLEKLGGYFGGVTAIVLIIAAFIGGWQAALFFHPQQIKTVEINQSELLKPQVIEAKVDVPYKVAKEIVKEIPVVKEVKVPVKDPDRIITVPATSTEPAKEYNIVLDRKWEVGGGISNHGFVGAVQYNPNKYTGIEVIGNRDIQVLNYKFRF